MEGQSPHGAWLKVYVNQPVSKNPTDFPNKSIIIKENYTEGKELAAVTIMYNVEGYNEDAGDWYWVKYLPDRKVAQKEDTQIAGKVSSCIACHSSAKGDDYVFINDE